eukprot:TRINITY_DN9988_c0_g1_i1.p1 TRINITY_DN9988_c0_g1~~TRINITY_DN9988_c0_g1_i1.p1  ORF type:complete len:219 (-),score=41.76 TRINITY_DN9988_c0_g1_i1:79-735(-)
MILADAPEGHDAHRKVTFKPSTLSWSFRERTGGAGQATLPQVGGSHNAASRIARLMYVKFSEGGDKDALKAYQRELYQLVKNSFPNLPTQQEVMDQHADVSRRKRDEGAPGQQKQRKDAGDGQKKEIAKKSKDEKQTTCDNDGGQKKHSGRQAKVEDSSGTSSSDESDESSYEQAEDGKSRITSGKVIARPKWPKGRVAAKMMARSGLYCPRTFTRLI